MKNRKDIIDYLEFEEADFKHTREELEAMSDYELFNEYLEWEGIVGYTDSILETVEKIFGVELKY